MNADALLGDNRNERWFQGGLEAVPACPVCRSERRERLHAELWDSIFFAAPGRWTLWQCCDCRSGFLDPRPTEATIGLAYSTYYTHRIEEAPIPRTVLQKLRAGLGNGYRNARYGTHMIPTSWIGPVLAAVLPSARRSIDLEYRYLPRKSAGRPMRVLDVGCGGGEFLRLARMSGWEAAGVEPDPVAAAAARDAGFDVRGTIDDWHDEQSTFDYVTMNHVIEHVHDPLLTLRTIRGLLRLGGGLFIDTPNIDALSHALFGPNWRGLEVPRHLVIFNRESLARALTETGFVDVAYRTRPSPLPFMLEQSRCMQLGLDPYAPHPPIAKRSDRLLRLRSDMSPARSEFLTVTALRG